METLISPSQVGKLAQGPWASGGRAGVFPSHLRCYAPTTQASPSETSEGLPDPGNRPGGLCSGGRDLPQSPSRAGARPDVQVSGLVSRCGRPSVADRVGGSKEGRSGKMGGVPSGDEGEALGRHGRQLGSEGGRGARRREVDPHPPSPAPQPAGRVYSPPPPPSRELLAARERETKVVSGERLGGRRLCGGVIGGC